MTSMYDEPSPSMLASIASEIIERHDDGKPCDACTPNGCAERAWATSTLARHRAARAALIAAGRRW